MWLDYGFELGNHTFSHSSLNQVGLPAWEDDIVQGESVTRQLLAEHNMKLRYFRHPIWTPDAIFKPGVRRKHFSWLAATTSLPSRSTHGTGCTPESTTMPKSVATPRCRSNWRTATSPTATQVFAYAEQLSKQTIGYEPKQILLLHANQLEADHIGELLDVLRKRGYHFVTLGDALSDQAYGLPDTYVGEEGTGWLEHWAITLGKASQGAPFFRNG